MKLDRIILASDLNANYIQFWPLVSRVWRHVTGARPTLFFVAPLDTPIEQVEGCDIIYVPPPPDLPPCFVAQTIRLLAPSWFPEDVCVVSDIDLMVVKPHFFPSHIEKYDLDQMVILNRYLPKIDRPSLSYHVAQGKFWARLFDVAPGPKDWSMIFEQLRKWHTEYAGQWATDEIILHEHVTAMKKKNSQSIVQHFTPHLWYKPFYSVTHYYREFSMDHSKLFQYLEVEPPGPYLQHRHRIHSILQALLPKLPLDQVKVLQTGIVRKNRHPIKQAEEGVKVAPKLRLIRPLRKLLLRRPTKLLKKQ
jgi:hypothetical protein